MCMLFMTPMAFQKARLECFLLLVLEAPSFSEPLLALLLINMEEKKSCLVYAILYGLSCFTKHFNDFNILLIGRLLGGMATSILYSGFESWLVFQHHKKGFNEEWLATTFSRATFGNGLIAILSGLLANSVKDLYGYVAPFDTAILFLVIGGVVIVLTWEENYGDQTIDNVTQFRNAFRHIFADRKVAMLGCIQSFFEGGMFTFVFMWTPALANPEAELPHGWIFASFMVCVMTGSNFFKFLISRYQLENFMRGVFVVATISLSFPIFTSNPVVIFSGFLMFEICVGIFWPGMGTMRSKYIPEESRATIMNIFRIPLNAIVVALLFNVGAISTPVVFMCCVGFLSCALFCQNVLFKATHSTVIHNTEIEIDSEL